MVQHLSSKRIKIPNSVPVHQIPNTPRRTFPVYASGTATHSQRLVSSRACIHALVPALKAGDCQRRPQRTLMHCNYLDHWPTTYLKACLTCIPIQVEYYCCVCKGLPWEHLSVHKALSLWLVGAYVKYPQLHSQLLFACYTTYTKWQSVPACMWYVNVHHCYLVGFTAYRSRAGTNQYFIVLQKYFNTDTLFCQWHSLFHMHACILQPHTQLSQLFFSPAILQAKKSWDGWVQGCAWCSLGHLKSTIASKRGGSECPQGVTFQAVYQNGVGWEYQMYMTTLNTWGG